MNNLLFKESIKIFAFTSFLFYLPLYFYFCISTRIYDLASFLYTFIRWDSGWYLGIAQMGYPQVVSPEIVRGDLVYLWPPLYPLILKIVTALLPFPIGVSVFLLQSVTIFVVIFTTLRLLSLFVNFADSKKITLLFILFPISIFFYSAYSEGLFLIFLNLFIYYLIKEKNYKAAIFGSFLPIIRYIGIFSILFFNFYFLVIAFNKNKKRIVNFSQIINFVCLNIIFLTPFSFWMFYNFLNTSDPLFFISVKDSLVAFQEWGKYRNPFYFYFLKWINLFFHGKNYWIEYKLAGLFVLLYVWMNFLSSKTEVKNSLKLSIKVLSLMGMFFAIFPFTTGIESLWRYGYIFPFQFLFLRKFIKKDYVYTFILILFACFKIAFGIAFISSLHIT